MKALSLFSGAGGLDLGCEAAGFRTVAAVEWDRTAQATMLANWQLFPDLRPCALLDDVTTLGVDELLDRAGVQRGELALVHGGPPCTPFSKSGYWLEYKRLGADPRASLLDHYVRMLAGTRPKAYVMENVYGLAYRNQNQAVFDRFQHGVRDAGYSLSWRILLAADYGVPQLRQRLVCVGVRSDVLDCPVDEWEFQWPKPTHSGPHETRKGWDESLPGHVSAGEALRDMSEATNPSEFEESVDGTYAEELRDVPPGENYLFWTTERGHPAPRFKWRSRYWNFLLKLDPARPSPTIQGQPGPWVGPFHWDSRRLRVAEVRRLMTFPDRFIVLGTRREQQLQLGNAVPPVLGRVVADGIARARASRRSVGRRRRACGVTSGVMGITISASRLEEVLERAVVLAESDVVLPQIWTDRVHRIGECPSKTYVAALGTALLAKATEPRVDALSVKSKAGPRAYSMRGVVRVLVGKAPVYGYHLGRTGPEPLNNQPWFGSDRVDRFENVRADAMPYHRDIVRYLTDLNTAGGDQAMLGLAAFLRERIAFGESERLAAARVTVQPAHDLAALIRALVRFLREDAEGGRRGQALVAAVLDLAHDEVSLAAVNDPTGIDVAVTDEGRLLLAVEVKQKAVDEATALLTAERAASQGADKALLVALAEDQRAVDRERVRKRAADEHAVALGVWESVEELLTEVALQAPMSAAEVAAELPAIYLRRMREHGVSLEGQQYWADLVAALYDFERSR